MEMAWKKASNLSISSNEALQPEDTPTIFAKLKLALQIFRGFWVQASPACVTKHPERNLSNIVSRWFLQKQVRMAFCWKPPTSKSEKVMDYSGVICIFHIVSSGCSTIFFASSSANWETWVRGRKRQLSEKLYCKWISAWLKTGKKINPPEKRIEEKAASFAFNFAYLMRFA